MNILKSRINNQKVLLPQVVVYADRQADTDLIRRQVQQAVGTTGVDCMVLAVPGLDTSPARQQTGTKDVARPVAVEPVEFSVVIPVYNEDSNLPELYRRLTQTMSALKEPYELVFVDDGSKDKSPHVLEDLHRRDQAHIRIISLSRNFGHQRAVSAGLDYACGQAVLVMDADLQDPPEVIPQFIEKWREGFEVVYAVREKRKEHILKRAAYHAFYLILRAVSKIEIPLASGDFCLMDRCVVDAIKALPERNRFVRGLRSWVGFKQTGLSYEREARFAGETKYSFGKLMSLALDGLISFSYFPLRLATILGFCVSALSLLAAIYYFTKAATVGLQPPGFATQVVLISFLGGIQLITIGIIGEYIGQLLEEVKHRPTYVVREVLETRSSRG